MEMRPAALHCTKRVLCLCPTVAAADIQHPPGPVREQSDCRATAIPDTTTPFRSIEDAVDRLLPYHIMATEEGDDADVDDTHDGEGGNLLCSRR